MAGSCIPNFPVTNQKKNDLRFWLKQRKERKLSHEGTSKAQVIHKTGTDPQALDKQSGSVPSTPTREAPQYRARPPISRRWLNGRTGT